MLNIKWLTGAEIFNGEIRETQSNYAKRQSFELIRFQQKITNVVMSSVYVYIVDTPLKIYFYTFFFNFRQIGNFFENEKIMSIK